MSDGHTKIQARLTNNVVDILEAELEGKLERNTGDVIALKQFVVVITCTGSEHEWVQLTVEEIEYLYHRRKNLGQPTPIEQQDNIRALVLDSVTALLYSRPEPDSEDYALPSQDVQGEEDDFQSQEIQGKIVSKGLYVRMPALHYHHPEDFPTVMVSDSLLGILVATCAPLIYS